MEIAIRFEDRTAGTVRRSRCDGGDQIVVASNQDRDFQSFRSELHGTRRNAMEADRSLGHDFHSWKKPPANRVSMPKESKHCGVCRILERLQVGQDVASLASAAVSASSDVVANREDAIPV